MTLNPLQEICPCGRVGAKATPLTFAECCGRWIESGISAPDAESLMRSRYCAFVMHDALYLLKTWHAGKRPSKISFDAGVKWLGLEVRDAKNFDPDHAEVEFVARQREPNGRAVRLVERSRFVRENGAWFYVDGTHL